MSKNNLNPKVIASIGKVNVLKEPVSMINGYIPRIQEYRISFVGSIINEEDIQEVARKNSFTPEFVATSVNVFYDKIGNAYRTVVNGIEINKINLERSSIKPLLDFNVYLNAMEGTILEGIQLLEGDIKVLSCSDKINIMKDIYENLLNNICKINKIGFSTDMLKATIKCFQAMWKVHLLN